MPSKKSGRVIMGKADPAQTDIVCLNAAPLLYVSDVVGTLEDGVARARKAILDGSALTKLKDWVRWQNVGPDDGMPTLDAKIAGLG